MRNSSSERGSAVVEYAILLPVIMACVLICVFIFVILYEKTQLQNLADDTVAALSRQWTYKPLPLEEMKSGVYKRETYENREIYPYLKILANRKKENAAEDYISDESRIFNILRPFVDDEGIQSMPEVRVDFKHGIPARLQISITAKYETPAKSLLKLIGMRDYITINVSSKASVFDTKDMINNIDYVVQIIRGTKSFKDFSEKLKQVNKELDKFTGEN